MPTLPDKTVGQCPECEGEVPLDDLTTGVIFICPDCNVDLELREIEPVTLALAPKEAEDWGE